MIKSMIKQSAVSHLRAPLIQPFRTALGQHDALDNLLFQVELSDGTKGFGEAAVATHITGETIPETLGNLQAWAQESAGRDAGDYLALSSELHARLPHNKAAVAAVEMAVLDALTRQLKIPLGRVFGLHTQRLVTDITIVIADLEETQESTRRFYAQGFRAFKVKIGRDEDLDHQRVAAVRRLAPGAEIYLDANQGYTADQTLKFVKRLQRVNVRVALLEQPVPRDDWEGLKRVSRLAGVPVCADESVRTMGEALRLIRERAAPVLNIKLMKFGLIQAAEIARLARAAGVELMIGGMMETSLAMTAAAHLASGVGGFRFIDLDPPFFIKEGLRKNPVLSRKGVYDLTVVKSGIGLIPPTQS